MQKVSYCEEGNIVSVRPYVTQEVVIHLAKDLYGLDIDVNEEIKELVSYADRNFLVKGIIFNLLRLIFLLRNDLCKRYIALSILSKMNYYKVPLRKSSVRVVFAEFCMNSDI